MGGALLTTTWGWTADGQLSTLGLPSGRGSELVYTLSGADHLPERLLDAGGSTLVELLSRDGELRPTALEFHGRRLKLFYDALGRPIERSWDAGSSWAGHWDDRGRLDTESYVDPASDWTADYSYAEPGWLEQEVITESGSQAPWVRDYGYDAGGRRESVSDDAGLLRELGWSGALPEAHDGVVQPIDPWDALAQDPSGASLSRDPSGALSDRLTASGELTSWSRDPSGLPVLSMEPDGDRWTTWGLGGALPLEVQTPTEDIQNIVFEGLWLGQVREGGAVEGALTVLSDPRGSLLNLGGEALGPHGAFGERASAPSGFDERFVYAGLERLPDGGLMLARHRAMLPEQGVFDRPDPLGLGGGLHRARYAENNPLGFVDPLGFTAQPVTGSSGTWSAGVGGVGGGVGGVQDPCRNGVEACGSWEKAKRLGGVVYARGGDEGDEDEDAEEETEPGQWIVRLQGGVLTVAVYQSRGPISRVEVNMSVPSLSGIRRRLSDMWRGVSDELAFAGDSASNWDGWSPMWAGWQGTSLQFAADMSVGAIDPIVDEAARYTNHPKSFVLGREVGRGASYAVAFYEGTAGTGLLNVGPPVAVGAGSTGAGAPIAAISFGASLVGAAGVSHGSAVLVANSLPGRGEWSAAVADGSGGGAPEEMAEQARDALAKAKRRKHATYAGGHKDGRVVAGCSGNPRGCAEDDIARQLGSDAKMTKALGWRRSSETGLRELMEIAVCVRCQEKYSPSQFPVDVKVDPGGAWGR